MLKDKVVKIQDHLFLLFNTAVMSHDHCKCQEVKSDRNFN